MAQKRYPSDEQDRFIVRLPSGMRGRIAKAAKANKRSMNSEVVGRLEASFSGDERSKAAAAKLLRMTPDGSDPVVSRLDDLEVRVWQLEKRKR